MTVLAMHIIAGALGLIFGFVALYSSKGEPRHRKVGLLFVYAIIPMALLGVAMALIWGVAPAANVPVGLFTAYLATTALTTVRPARPGSRRVDFGLMLLVLAVGLVMVGFGVAGASSPGGRFHGMPAAPFFVFGPIALLAGMGDFLMIQSGGVQALRSAARLARHLWRMSFALLIAAFSFFLGQAKIIPQSYRIFPLLVVPPLLVLATLLYWFWRVRAGGGEVGFKQVPVR